MSTSISPSSHTKSRAAGVLFGPPGLFLGLTLTVLVLGGFVGHSTAAPRRAAKAPAALSSVRTGASRNFEKKKDRSIEPSQRFDIVQDIAP